MSSFCTVMIILFLSCSVAFSNSILNETESFLERHRPHLIERIKERLEDVMQSETVNASYSEENAKRPLHFSYGAYCNKSSIESWSCKWCQMLPQFQITNVTKVDHLQAFVGYDSNYDEIVVSFRGTHNIEDWLDDMDALQLPYPGVDGGYVHKGFYDSWLMALKPSILTATQRLINKHRSSPILITGHSLGGALAQLCALDIANLNGTAPISLYTFGSPRWGNLEMINYFESVVAFHWRMVNMKDLVPTVPYQDIGDHSQYHHSSTQVWYVTDTPLSYILCDGSGEDSQCKYWGDSIQDHLHYLGIYESCPDSDPDSNSSSSIV